MNVTQGCLIFNAKAMKYDLILHGCNCFNVMGAGVAKKIREEFPEAYLSDCKTTRGDKSKLGTYTVAKIEKYNLLILNAYTQYNFKGYGDKFEYDSFKTILNNLLLNYPGIKIGLPFIGMGLAGGNSIKIIEILKDFSLKYSLTGGSVEIVTYIWVVNYE